MPTLSEILRDPNYINANEATKRAIFERYAPQDQNYTSANEATQAAIQQRFGLGGGAVAPTPAPEGGFIPAVKRGFYQTGVLLGDVLPAMAARAVGADEYAEKQWKEAAATQQKIQREMPAAVPSYTDVKSLGDAWTYAKEAVGESIASLLPAILTGGLAGVAGRGATIAAKEAAERVLLAEAAKRGPPTKAAIDAATAAGVKAAQREALKYQAKKTLAQPLHSAGLMQRWMLLCLLLCLLKYVRQVSPKNRSWGRGTSASPRVLARAS